MLRIELLTNRAIAGKLYGSGMIVVNPPFVLEDEMKSILPALLKALAPETGSHRLEWIRGARSRCEAVTAPEARAPLLRVDPSHTAVLPSAAWSTRSSASPAPAPSSGSCGRKVPEGTRGRPTAGSRARAPSAL